MNMTLYAADHAAACKPTQLYFKWMAVEMEEYYQQGDLEKKLDFSVTAFYDRATCNPFKFQLGYIDVIVKPLFNAYCEFKENLFEILIEQGLTENRKLLEQKVEETKNLQHLNVDMKELVEHAAEKAQDSHAPEHESGEKSKTTANKSKRKSEGESSRSGNSGKPQKSNKVD